MLGWINQLQIQQQFQVGNNIKYLTIVYLIKACSIRYYYAT